MIINIFRSTLTSKILLFSALVMLAGACKNDSLIRRGDSLEVAFNKAKRIYDSGDYVDAANAFETVTRIARGTEYGEDAQYYLAESYYRSRQYLLAASEFDRFSGYYPRDERREEAEFKAAECYYNLSPRYQLDQAESYAAIERYQLFINRYPNADKVDEAAQRINELRSKLGRKIFSAAQFYDRTQQYRAAAIYYGLTIDKYPETKWAEQALVNQVRTYIAYADNSIRARQAERYQNALDAYEKFIQLYPQSKLRAEIENYRDDAQQKLDRIQRQQSTQSTQTDS